MILGWFLIGLGIVGAYASYTAMLAWITRSWSLWFFLQATGIIVGGCVGLVAGGSILVSR